MVVFVTSSGNLDQFSMLTVTEAVYSTFVWRSELGCGRIELPMFGGVQIVEEDEAKLGVEAFKSPSVVVPFEKVSVTAKFTIVADGGGREVKQALKEECGFRLVPM